MLKPGCQSILVLRGIVFLGIVVGNARAQPLVSSFKTIEAHVGQADQVVVGTIDNVVRQTIVAPRERGEDGTNWPEGRFEYTLTLKVDEILKGNPEAIIDGLHTDQVSGEDARYEQWMEAKTPMLWFLGSTPESGQQRQWDYLPMGGQVPAEQKYNDPRRKQHFSKDFRRLKDTKEVLAHARAYAKTMQEVQPVHSIQVPNAIVGHIGTLNYLIVPVEPTLEHRAKRLIAAPQDFLLEDEDTSPWDLPLLRFGGVDSLQHFRSDENVELLLSLIDEPLSVFKSKHVCVRAYEILLHWGVETPLPKAAQEIQSLDLGGTDVTDQTLKQVAELTNLTRLDLQNTRITDAGLKELTSLTKLVELVLAESQLNDANLRVLRETGLLHCLRQADARPDGAKSAEEITSLHLYGSPITDAGLKELADLTNLRWLDLRDTQITDAGLKELAGLKNLERLSLQGPQISDAGLKGLAGLTHLRELALQDTRITDASLKELAGLKSLETLFLQGTQVTDAGIAELQLALPECHIQH